MNHFESDSPPSGMTPSRDLSDSSTERAGNVPAPARAKAYGFYYTKRRTNLQVRDEAKTGVYFANMSECSSTRPDVALHAGGDQAGPVVAVARFRFSRTVTMGLGDPENEREMVWEEMRNQDSPHHSQYRFEMSLNDERRAFLWLRTRAKEDGATKLSYRNYKLLDEKTGEVLALYVESGWRSWQKKGELEIRTDLGRVWELLVVLSSVSLCEKTSRRARRHF
jgi:hypothetical protein